MIPFVSLNFFFNFYVQPCQLQPPALLHKAVLEDKPRPPQKLSRHTIPWTDPWQNTGFTEMGGGWPLLGFSPGMRLTRQATYCAFSPTGPVRILRALLRHAAPSHVNTPCWQSQVYSRIDYFKITLLKLPRALSVGEVPCTSPGGMSVTYYPWHPLQIWTWLEVAQTKHLSGTEAKLKHTDRQRVTFAGWPLEPRWLRRNPTLHYILGLTTSNMLHLTWCRHHGRFQTCSWPPDPLWFLR